MPFGTKVGHGPGGIVLNGDAAPSPRGKQPPNFWPMSIVAKAGRIKMPLGSEVGFGPGHIVLNGDPALSSKRWWGSIPSPIFGPFIAAKRLDGEGLLPHHLFEQRARSPSNTMWPGPKTTKVGVRPRPAILC